MKYSLTINTNDYYDVNSILCLSEIITGDKSTLMSSTTLESVICHLLDKLDDTIRVLQDEDCFADKSSLTRMLRDSADRIEKN